MTNMTNEWGMITDLYNVQAKVSSSGSLKDTEDITESLRWLGGQEAFLEGSREHILVPWSWAVLATEGLW